MRLRALIAVVSVAAAGCAPSDPALSFLDDESGVSFVHPPRWQVGAAEQSGLRYRYLTAPKIEGDTDALSITIIAPTAAASAASVAQAYLSGATNIAPQASDHGIAAWTFRDSSGVSSQLRIASTADGRFFGGWARGSENAMKRYASRIDNVLGSLRVEDPVKWPEERFSGMTAHAPPFWTRGSRLSNPTNATMQFQSPPLFVEKGTATIHGFATVSREPVPPPGDLEAFSKLLKDRASDTVAVVEHRPWLELEGVDRTAGYMDYMRSGNAMTATRIRRWITVKNRVGLTFACEARADVFDRLDPWCWRMAYTVRLE